jgi:hypothetical protein
VLYKISASGFVPAASPTTTQILGATFMPEISTEPLIPVVKADKVDVATVDAVILEVIMVDAIMLEVCKEELWIKGT